MRILAAVALAFFVAEAGGQMVHRLWTGRWFAAEYLDSRARIREADVLFEAHPYLVAQLRQGARLERGGKVISTTSFRTRTIPAAPAGTRPFRIACLGGSTTFGTGVGDASAWPALLQGRLGDGFEVWNFGLPGYSTVEGIIQMALLVPEQKPDVIVFYEGWNDIRAYHDPRLTPDFQTLGVAQQAHLLPVVEERRNSVLEAAGRVSVVAHTLHDLADWLGWSGGPGPVARGRAVPPSVEPDPAVDRLYLRNLVTLKVLARRFGASSIFVPQVLNDAKFVQRPPVAARGWTPRIQDVAMPALMKRFGEVMGRACETGESDCQFADEVLRVRWSPEDFVDDGHFSRTGGEKLVGVLDPLVRRAESLRRAESPPP